MRSVALKVLKDKLGEYIELAAAGERVLVTDRDRVVAELVPPQGEQQTPLSEEEFFEKGAREGWLTPPTHPAVGVPERKPVMSFEELIEDLKRARDDR